MKTILCTVFLFLYPLFSYGVTAVKYGFVGSRPQVVSNQQGPNNGDNGLSNPVKVS